MTHAALVIAGVCLIAGIVAGSTGFGFALLAVPALSTVVEPPIAIGISTLAGAPGAAWIAWRDRAHLATRMVRWIAPSAVVAMPIGLVVLHVVPDRSLSIGIGIVVLISTLALRADGSATVSAPTLAAVGATSGVLATSAGTSAPPVVLLCRIAGMSPPQLRATVAGILAVQCVFALCGLVGTHAIAPDDVHQVLAAQIPTAVGWILGVKASDRLSHDVLARVTTWLLLTSGASAIFHGLLG